MNQIYNLPRINRYGELIMSLLQKNVTLRGNNGAADVTALFDSGAGYSCIRLDIAKDIGILEPLDEPMVFSTADEGSSLRAEYAVRLSFYFHDTNRRFTDEFIVIDSLSEPLIIGAKTMQAWRITLDFDREEILYDRKMHKLRI